MAAAVDLYNQHRHVSAIDAIPDAVPVRAMAKERATLAMVNNNGGRAPPLTLMKRVTPPKEETMSFTELLKAATSMIERGNYDAAEHLLNKADRLINKAATSVRVHNYGNNNDDDEDEDNGDYEDTWSESADARSKYNNAKKASSNNNDDMDDDEDDDDDDEINKASYHHQILGGSKTLPEPRGGLPLSTGHKADTYSLGSSPAVRSATPHKFDRLVDHVMERDSCSKNEAMATARREYPDVYTSYQGFVASSPTNEQHTRRAGRGVAKRMPDTFEDLVSAEMAKGVSWRTAEQRVINTYGSTALNHRMMKSSTASVAAEFTKRADQILWDTPNIDRCEALRRLRKANPYLYDALNSV
jgi:hypothetical protein